MAPGLDGSKEEELADLSPPSRAGAQENTPHMCFVFSIFSEEKPLRMLAFPGLFLLCFPRRERRDTTFLLLIAKELSN